MKRLAPLAAVTLLALTACGSGGTEGATASAAPSLVLEDGMGATVVSVESANTFTAEIDGATRSVRLINTSAPSTNGIALSHNCLVEESTALLAEKLPEGSQVTLNFDETQRGGTGYIEAAVYSGDALINADMARAGMVATTFTSANDKFYAEISQAQQDAASEEVGLYAKGTDCTIPANIEGQRAAVEDARSWEVADDDTARANEREKVYQDASQLYNTLEGEASAPGSWVGSIVTLEAVDQQLDDLKNLLGDDYYPEKGISVNQHGKASAEATPARPGS